MIITRTPYRLSFFGGGTDYNPWFEKHGGLVIGAAVKKYCWISLRELPPFFEHKSRFVYGQTEQVSSNFLLKHPGARSCFEFLKIDDGLEIHYDGDLPSRSGIGSSSSFTVGLLHALYAYQNKMIDKRKLAENAIYVEQKIEQQNVGIQDQIFASYGGCQVIRMSPHEDFRVNSLILPPEYLNDFSSHIMLGFSGITRNASLVAKKQMDNIKAGVIDNQLLEILDIANTALSLFIKNENIDCFGKLFDETWKLKRTLTNSTTNNHLDLIYDVAIKNGALGGRLLGAGEGGFLMFLAPPSKHQQIKDALTSIKVWVPFQIEPEGSRVILHHNDKL